MSEVIHTLDALEGLLEGARETLDKQGIPLLPVRWSKTFEEAPGVSMDDPRLENLAAAIRPGAHAFYWWDELAIPETDDGERVALRLALWQDGLVYNWSLYTQRWFDFLDETEGEAFDDEIDTLGRRLPELTPEQDVLAKRLENEPNAVLNEFVQISLDALAPTDLRPQPWKVARIGEQELGLRDLPWGLEARNIAHDLVEKARHEIEAKLAERVDTITNDLVNGFQAWYQGKGEPRLTKALVKMYVQEQGYQAPGTFIDDLKVRIDVAMLKAA